MFQPTMESVPAAISTACPSTDRVKKPLGEREISNSTVPFTSFSYSSEPLSARVQTS